MWVLFAQQNTIKTATQTSRINFYFVTCFYSFVRYLHSGHEDVFFRQEDMKNMFFDRKT